MDFQKFKHEIERFIRQDHALFAVDDQLVTVETIDDNKMVFANRLLDVNYKITKETSIVKCFDYYYLNNRFILKVLAVLEMD